MTSCGALWLAHHPLSMISRSLGWPRESARARRLVAGASALRLRMTGRRPLGSRFRSERVLEPSEGGVAVFGGPGFEADDAGVAGLVQAAGDSGVVDLAGARFAAARYVGDLNLADVLDAVADQLDQVSLADLRVVEVEVHSQVRAVDGLNERSRVGGLGERGAGMVHGGVEVLEAEHHSFAFPQLGDADEGLLGLSPHGSGHRLDWPGGQSLAVESRSVQVEVRRAERVRGGDGLLGGPEEGVGAFRFGEVAFDVAGHGGEPRAGGRQALEVSGGPVPDLHGEPEVVDDPDAFTDRFVEEHHLRTHGEGEAVAVAHRASTLSAGTGDPALTDSMLASASTSARRASSPVTAGVRPSRTALVNSTNSAV